MSQDSLPLQLTKDDDLGEELWEKNILFCIALYSRARDSVCVVCCMFMCALV